jgi:HPt (histidine-containing phosphotransfer) domain-containing protein
MVDLNFIGEKLAIDNVVIIKKLLNSFARTAQELIDKIDEKKLDADIIHNIKGVAGNLRFNNLYELAISMEKSINTWDDADYKKYSELVVKHLKKLLEQIQIL